MSNSENKHVLEKRSAEESEKKTTSGVVDAN